MHRHLYLLMLWRNDVTFSFDVKTFRRRIIERYSVVYFMISRHLESLCNIDTLGRRYYDDIGVVDVLLKLWLSMLCLYYCRRCRVDFLCRRYLSMLRIVESHSAVVIFHVTSVLLVATARSHLDSHLHLFGFFPFLKIKSKKIYFHFSQKFDKLILRIKEFLLC